MNISTHISRVLYIVGSVVGLNTGSVVILCYHALDKANKYSVSVAEFKKQILNLRKTHTFISMDEFISGKRISPKKNYVVLTFDDGYKNVLEVKDFLNDLRITPTLFVLADIHNVDRKELDHTGKFLSWDEIKLLSDEGWIIGSHGTTHRDFSRISQMELISELFESKKTIESKITKTVTYFAYPKGIVNSEIKKIVKKAGYTHAFGVTPLPAKKKKYRFDIPRFVVEKSYRASEMSLKISPSTLFVRSVFDRTRSII